MNYLNGVYVHLLLSFFLSAPFVGLFFLFCSFAPFLRLARNAGLDQRAVGPGVAVLGGHLGELVGLGVEGAGRPANVAEEDVGVLAGESVGEKRDSGNQKRETHFINWIWLHRYFWHEAVLPPPVSVLRAWRLLARSQVARGWKAVLMLSVTHSVWVPELSESRYLWTSMMSPSKEPSGFLTLSRAGPDLVGICWADVQLGC